MQPGRLREFFPQRVCITGYVGVGARMPDDNPMIVNDMSEIAAETIADMLAQIAGSGAVISELGQRVFFATDIAARGVTAEAVVQVSDTATLSAVVKACTEAGRIVIPRGGGFSYTGGYTPARDRTVIIDMRPMDRIVEINTEDMYVIVEAGCTWERLYTALKARGVRTPYFGPMSGYRATVGGALSQGSLFLGSTAHGVVAESVLGLEVVLADGRVVRTGSWASADGVPPFFRNYGPDPTGMFLSDSGAMGFKTSAVLRLIPFPPAQAYGTFAFQAHGPALAALSEIGRAALAAECYCWDPFFVARVMAAASGTKEDLRYLLNVVKSGSGLLDGLGGAMRIALAGKRSLSGNRFFLNVVIDDASAGGAAARLKQIRAIARHFGGAEISPSAPRTLRGTPFTDFNTAARRTSERNLPVNSLSPHSRAAAVADQVYGTLARHAGEMARLGLQCGVIFFAVGAQAVCIEPLIYWQDPEHALHDRIAETTDLAALAGYTERPEATRTAFELRAALKEVFRRNGCAHVQIGRAYPWAATREPNLLALVRAFKHEVDPHDLINRGSLSLDRQDDV
jgi:FAD/FMN-containing dehydrogenase